MRPDVLIVGAGTAGAAAALLCAERGMRVHCIDARPLESAGARWVNGVPGWAFDEAGLPRPEPPERLDVDVRFHLIAGEGPSRVTIEDHGLMEVDMRRLVARLQSAAARAGVTFQEQVRVLGFDGETLETTAGPLQAGVFVDASGLRGARLLGSPPVPRDRLCAAAQELRRVRDDQAARAFFAAHDVRPGDVLCFTGLAGGFSITNLRYDGEHLAILTGSIPAQGNPSGPVMVQDFLRRSPWVGERVFGGARAIPLRRPYAVVGRGRVAALGDAACQVHTAHGSGIAPGLIAARMLADALAADEGPAGYNLRWQRRWGGELASAEVFCRFSQTLTVDDVRAFAESGIMGPRLSRAMLAQRPPLEGVADLPRSAWGLARNPALASRLLPVLTRMARARAHYARYPRDPEAVPAWAARLDRIAGA
ncbi:MAG: FAD-binding protein [Alphaproteobacteria bacterium]|nr:FAD-binding protein [Alphaproteobacteria bacterium]